MLVPSLRALRIGPKSVSLGETVGKSSNTNSFEPLLMFPKYGMKKYTLLLLTYIFNEKIRGNLFKNLELGWGREGYNKLKRLEKNVTKLPIVKIIFKI